jgi:hypothetical protein
MQVNNTASQATAGNLVSYFGWLETLDKTRTTGWRWRKNGLIQTVNIFGKLYVTRDEISRFEQRAMSGEFHKEVVTPTTRHAIA